MFDGDPPRSQVDRAAAVSRSQRPRCVLNLRALQGRTSEGSADGSAAAENYADLVRRMRAEARPPYGSLFEVLMIEGTSGNLTVCY